MLRDIPDDRLLYPHARGEPELRAALTAYLGRVRGVRATPDQIVVCGGFSQAVTLLCRALGRRGVTRVAVEDPCFSLYRRIIRSTGLEPVPVPVDGQGLRPRGSPGWTWAPCCCPPPTPTRAARCSPPTGGFSSLSGPHAAERW